MKRLNKAVLALATAGMLGSGVAQAGLNDRGGGLIYDDVLNITWLQDANYAKTSGHDPDGLMNWSAANTWAANLTYGGYSDWRLPTTAPVNGTAFNYDYSVTGATDNGYNVSAPGTTYAGSTGSEMANLFFNTLGNKAYYSPTTGSPQSGYGLTNAGPFQNVQSYVYWSGTAYAPNPAYYAWYFSTGFGSQYYGGQNVEFYAWAVRPGDVAAPIPEPETYAMLLAGLGLLGVVAKRRRRSFGAS